MGHEDAVYLAKLAEQAERYEGSLYIPPPKIKITSVKNFDWEQQSRISNINMRPQRWSRT
jgi:hypothetical protein